MFAVCQALTYMGWDAAVCTSRPLLPVLGSGMGSAEMELVGRPIEDTIMNGGYKQEFGVTLLGIYPSFVPS